MMKKYIILTGAIRNAGGAQLYTANKLSYMESLGWQPYTFFHVSGECKIKYLSRFFDGYIPDLARTIQTMSKKKVSRVIEKIVNVVGADGEIVIESNAMSLAFWGEAIAERINGKHVVFPLEETFWNITRKEAAFFEFKLQRKEIMTSTEGRLKQLFQSYYKDEYKSTLLGLKPFCSNVVDYTPIELPERVTRAETHKILSIGRLLKPYIGPMLDDVKAFARIHHGERFALIMIGGDSDPSVETSIKKKFKDIHNVELFLLGYVYPIPYEWIKIADVCIASSNSVLVSAEEGIPTIAVDGHDFKAIGVYGYTTNKKVFRDNEPIIPIVDLLEDIIIKNKYPKKLKPRNVQNELNNSFKSHLCFLSASTADKEYYKMQDVYSNMDCFIARIKLCVRELIIKDKK